MIIGTILATTASCDLLFKCPVRFFFIVPPFTPSCTHLESWISTSFLPTESCLISRPPPLGETQIFEITRKSSFCRRETYDTALEPPKCVFSSYKKHNDVRTSGTWSAHTRHTLKTMIFRILQKHAKIRSEARAPTMCLMSADTWVILPSWKATLRLSNAVSQVKIG